MIVENAVYPDEEQMAGFLEPGHTGPIYMINLLRFRDKAEYEDGRVTELSGRQAYDLYGSAVGRLLPKFGGGAMFKAEVSRLSLGKVEDLWDVVAIVQYPSKQAMLDMLMSPEMQEIGAHRAAGLAGQLNIETVDGLGAWLGQDKSGGA
ncbi:MAG: DUF1330 domain-containing protein [Halioglobus sp.]|nr:DUF1330 domain-containing protein [Halioglobus sp.]